MQPTSEDLVVLLDAAGKPSGTADRMTVHGPDTPLHLAFSCYVVDHDQQILMTRRALGKKTWPGVWTNACCGHPRPGESMGQAITRRVEQELGARITDLHPALPDFRYEAIDASGVRENEVCPVYVAVLDGHLHPDPDEVMEYHWAQPAALAEVAARSPWLLSPWSVAQIDALDLPRLAQHALASAH
ncbi:MAG: isopentenyl-diphosphate Delta-isomerase [Candidatus Nanopelagicales bacterium]